MTPHRREFVVLSKGRTHFELNERPFFFCGANCYYLLTRAADPALRHEVTSVLDSIAAAGLTVVRTWAFNDGQERWNALQPQPGVYCERVFRALDYVIAESGRRGLKLLLDLTNYWEEYGGMVQYVKWSRGQRGLLEAGCTPEEFYTDPGCQHMYRRWMRAVLLRVNTITGVPYRLDPTILAWGLANEPQCRGDPPGGGTIARWASQAAAYVKSLDPHHLVTLDCEGFLGGSSEDARCWNPYDCTCNGCDFQADCACPCIDFACCHLYPDLWLPNAPEQAKLDFALSWVDVHAKLASQLGKPLVVSEFGKKAGRSGHSSQGLAGQLDMGSRRRYFKEVLGRVLDLMQRRRFLAGSIFWMTAAPSYPDYDGFTIYLPPAPTSRPQHAQHGSAQSQNARHSTEGRDKGGIRGALRGVMRSVLGDASAASVDRPGPADPALLAVQPEGRVVSGSRREAGTVDVILTHAADVAQLNIFNRA